MHCLKQRYSHPKTRIDSGRQRGYWVLTLGLAEKPLKNGGFVLRTVYKGANDPNGPKAFDVVDGGCALLSVIGCYP